MIVEINEKYRVIIDNYNHTLQEYIPEHIAEKSALKIKKGDVVPERWEVIGYYPNMIQCLNKCVALGIASSMGTNIQDYIDTLKTLLEQYHNSGNL